MTVNGYAIEPGGAGGWWVRRPGRRPLAWRFATRHEAVRFAHRLRPAGAAAPPAPAPSDAAALRDRLAAWLGIDNWVWSPQGAINMHMPERWGFVLFSSATAGDGTTEFVEDRNERVKWALRRLDYRQRDYRSTHGRYASDLSLLNVADIRVDGMEFRPSIQATDSLDQLRAAGFEDAVVTCARTDGCG